MHRPLQWWIVSLPAGATIAEHTHDGDYSAVYYPSDSDGVIVFPRGTIIQPRAGMLVTFRADEPHSVKAHTADERISVAFNRL